jgi:pimeloyl-ACP methyl ester carboxylesterase
MDSASAIQNRGTAMYPAHSVCRYVQRHAPCKRVPAGYITLASILLLCGACSQKWVTLRSVPRNPLGDELQLSSYHGPQPSPSTMQLLRVDNLTDDLEKNPRRLLEKLERSVDADPTAETMYALSELAYLEAVRTEKNDPQTAISLYGSCALHAYAYLFDNRLAASRNCYDPHFRSACDLYNAGLEAGLRILCKKGELVPGACRTIRTGGNVWDIRCELRGGKWLPQDIERFEFVSDYEMKGLKNRYQTHGLGVPLIAVRHNYPGEPTVARYYPASLSFPVTALLRPLTVVGGSGGNHGVLELYDPLAVQDTRVGDLCVPLESDLTTPLAYFLSKVPIESLATVALFQPEKLLEIGPNHKRPLMGLYMAQPYEPGKIPVVLIHGLWSSPMTWMEMFNDLRSSPDIRSHYQFWFYLYPTGQPFWLSAAELRRDLAELRQMIDPMQREPALDQMILVGHSMGGLVAKLQTTESGEDYWTLASRIPLERVRAEPAVLGKLHDTFFFHPNPSIRRVVMIATPNRGSTFSNQTTQYLLNRLIHLPDTLVNAQQKLFRDNADMVFDRSLLRIETSIDSLSPDSPILPVMLARRIPPWVKYHTIMGLITPSWWLRPLGTDTDGVVTIASARLEGAESELTVPADHLTVQCHPAAVMEVRRILHEHLAELRQRPVVGLRLDPVPGATERR